MNRPSASIALIERALVRRMALRISLFTTLTLVVILGGLDRGLHSGPAPLGIVSFELAGADAARILGEWTEAQRRDALLVQGLDYLFIPAYATLLATAALSVAARLGARVPRLTRVAPAAAWSAALAGAADVVENVPLIAMLRAGAGSPVGAAVAQVCASIKFGLLIVVLLYLICGSVALIRTR